MPSPRKKHAAAKAPPATRERTTITLSGELLKQIDDIAQRENRPRSRQIEVALREYVQRYQPRVSA